MLQLGAALLLGCRVIPIQLVRVAQLESYEQVFTVGVEETATAEAAVTAEERRKQALAEIGRVFSKLVGPQNWQTLKDRYGVGTIRDELRQKQIVLRGLMTLMMYLDPVDHDAFLLEGHGEYFLIRKRTGLVMLTGAFLLQPKRHRVTTLDDGVLRVEVELVTTRIPNSETYYHESRVVYEIALDTRLNEQGIYGIDYDVPHDVLQEGAKIAELTLDWVDTAGPSDKLIDLRGRQFLKDDYRSLLTDEENSRRSGGLP